MSVPSSISQLSTTPGLNSPSGSEPVGNNAALYIQAHAAFIAQIANGTQLKPSIPLSMSGLQINNLANGTATTDAATVGQLRNYLPVGAIMLYSGTAASIPTVWGSNWALCNGQNGTPNMTDRFVIGAGGSYVPGAIGGTTTYTLSIANMPVHNHGISDPGHSHGVADPGHSHGVADPGHVHGYPPGGWGQAGTDNGGISGTSASNQYGTFNRGIMNTYSSGTGISIYGSGTGIGIYGSGTGVSVNNNGSGQAFTVIPPYYALCYVMKVANS